MEEVVEEDEEDEEEVEDEEDVEDVEEEEKELPFPPPALAKNSCTARSSNPPADSIPWLHPRQ